MNAPPFNANPIIPVVIGSVLTICLRVSIYHLCPYMVDIYLSTSILCPYMEISVGPVLTICLPVSIYAHIWSYLSLSVHFMPIYGDLCRTRIDHLFACVHLCSYMEISVSVCLHSFYAHIWRSLYRHCTNCCGGERECRI